MRPHLIANHVNLMLHLGNPLTYDGEQLWNGGPWIHEDLQTGWVIRVKEGEGWRKMKKEKVQPHKEIKRPEFKEDRKARKQEQVRKEQ